jgi:ribonuclease BN (tRNA processing enzyme)
MWDGYEKIRFLAEIHVIKKNDTDKQFMLHCNNWNRSLALHSLKDISGQLTLCGYSKAAYRTGFRIEELDLYLDAGLSTFSNVNIVLISHGHGDHTFALGSFLMSPKHTDDSKIRIIAPQNSVDRIAKYGQSFMEANYNKDYDVSLVAAFEGISIGKSIVHSFSRSLNYKITAYKMFHTIPTVGYGLTLVNRRLNPRLTTLKLQQKELSSLIVAIKKGQIPSEYQSQLAGMSCKNINVEVEVPQFCYLTDTSIRVFQNEYSKQFYQYPIIIVECTFYADEDEKEAKSKKHIHWNHLRPIIVDNPANHFILIHHSTKYEEEDIKEIVSSSSGGIPHNVTFWLDSEPFPRRCSE